jgi:hypothetical protein
MRELTPQSVKSLYAMMTEAYGTHIIDKKDSGLMKAVAKLLDAIGVVDQKEFLKYFSVTIGYDIWLPFVPGDDTVPLVNQALVCAHEHQHVVVMEREGAALYGLNYLLASGVRAIYEAECYRANMECTWWYRLSEGWQKKKIDHENDYGRALEHYGLDARDRKVALASLKKAAKVVEKGGVSCGAAKNVIRFFGWNEVER